MQITAAPATLLAADFERERLYIAMGRAIRGFRTRKEAVARLEVAGYSQTEIMAYGAVPVAREIMRQIKAGERSSVRTRYAPPPIPMWEKMAWTAIDDDYEPGDPVGYGPTEFSAVQDLIEQLEDRD